MYVIGITGGIGTGKSTLANLFRQRGLPVLDADALSHEVGRKGSPALPELKALLGEEAVDEEGLRRAYVAQKVFQNRPLLDQLSFLVHRYVLSEMDRQRKILAKKGHKICVLDVPLPVKEGFLEHCNEVLVPRARVETRLKRLAQRGMSEEEARRRMNLQLSPEAYEKLATLVLENEGSVEELEVQLWDKLLPKLRERGLQLPELKTEEEQAGRTEK